ncbi:MAG: hypothetical protein ACE5GN_05510, partial [Waddliaceae bacterium]
MKKVISILFITFFVGFIALGALLQTEAVREYAKKTLIEKIHAETGYRVEIEDIRLYPSFQMRAIKGTLYDKDLPLLSFDHLHVGIYPLELKRGILHLSTLQIEGVKLIGSGTQERPFSLEDVPYKLKIDRFEIRYISQESPLVIKGNLYLDPKNFQISTHVTLFPKKDLEKWVSGDISYKKGNGSFQLNSVYNVTLNGEYLLASDATWRIPHFHGSYGVLDLDGNLSMTMDGKITDSSLFLSS